MKVIHLTTSFTNGAGKAARRINEAMNTAGLESTIVTTGRVEGSLENRESRLEPSPVNKLISKSITLGQEKTVNISNFPLTPISIQSLPVNQLNLESFDIVNVHATYNLLSFNSIKTILRLTQNLVITLHDERFYTGGCHNTFGCSQFKENCESCPSASQFGKKIVRKAFKLESNAISKGEGKISIIAPSVWIKDKARFSSKLGNFPVNKICNPIPEDVYHFLESETRLLPAPSKVTLGFVSASLDNPFKGLPELLHALELLDHSERSMYRIFLIGNQSKSIKSPIEATFFMSSADTELARILRSIDLLIVPSLGDNSPSVISESLMCGTKVIGSGLGGIPEMLGFNPDLIFDVSIPQTIIDKIRMNSDPYDRKAIAKKAMKSYSYTEVGILYKEYFKSLRFRV